MRFVLQRKTDNGVAYLTDLSTVSISLTEDINKALVIDVEFAIAQGEISIWSQDRLPDHVTSQDYELIPVSFYPV